MSSFLSLFSSQKFSSSKQFCAIFSRETSASTAPSRNKNVTVTASPAVIRNSVEREFCMFGPTLPQPNESSHRSDCTADKANNADSVYRARPRGHRLETARLSVPLRPGQPLAQDQEPGSAGSKARGG